MFWLTDFWASSDETYWNTIVPVNFSRFRVLIANPTIFTFWTIAWMRWPTASYADRSRLYSRWSRISAYTRAGGFLSSSSSRFRRNFSSDLIVR